MLRRPPTSTRTDILFPYTTLFRSHCKIVPASPSASWRTWPRKERDMPSKSPRCPLCGKPRDPEFKPFCGRGCRDRNLLNWFGEGYRVPVDQAPDGTADDDRFDEE